MKICGADITSGKKGGRKEAKDEGESEENEGKAHTHTQRPTKAGPIPERYLKQMTTTLESKLLHVSLF